MSNLPYIARAGDFVSIIPALPNGSQSSELQITTAGDIAATGGPSIVFNVVAYGATGNGITDDTAAINAASSAAGNGVMWFPVGTYNISSTLTLPGNQRWVGAGKQSAILQWVGDNGVDMVNTAVNTLYSGISDLGFNIVSATNMTMLRLRSSREGTFYKLHFEGGGGSLNNTVLFLEAGLTTGVAANCAHNSFWHIVGRNCAVGIVFQGYQQPITLITNAATDNSFYHLDLSSTPGLAGWIGIDFRHWCDTNQFYYTRLTLNGINGFGVIFNSLDPTGAASVYNETFSGLVLDNIGAITGATGLTINASAGIYITGGFISPVPYQGTLINADPANAQSYYIQFNNANIPGVNPMQVYQHWFGDHPDRNLDVPGFARTTGALNPNIVIGSANRLYATPVWIPNFVTLLTFAVYVGTANGVTDWNARCGLYADSGFCTPGALVPNTDTVIAIGQSQSTAFISSTINSGAGVPLIRGLYWAAFLCDDAHAKVLSSGPSGPDDSAYSATQFVNARASLGTGLYATATVAYGALPLSFGTRTNSPAADVPVTVLGF